MKTGGIRAGQGRPRKSSARPVIEHSAAINAAKRPLEYMLAVMCDPGVDTARRDRMAIAAAPFVHERLSDSRVGKREIAAMTADNPPNIDSSLGDLMSRVN